MSCNISQRATAGDESFCEEVSDGSLFDNRVESGPYCTGGLGCVPRPGG